jgi:hypothetical protein
MSENREIPATFTVRLTENGRKDLALIMAKLGVTVEEALSRAVGMEALLVQQADEGAEVILRDKKGNRHFVPVLERGDNAGRGSS